MRLASYNVENLFDRAKAMNQESWAAGRDALAAYAEFNGLIQKPRYSDDDKARMRAILLEFGLARSDDGKLARLRQNRGRLVSRPKIVKTDVTCPRITEIRCPLLADGPVRWLRPGRWSPRDSRAGPLCQCT